MTLYEINPPPELEERSDIILAAVAFPTNDIVASTWMNRVQNRVYFNLLNVETLTYNTVRTTNYYCHLINYNIILIIIIFIELEKRHCRTLSQEAGSNNLKRLTLAKMVPHSF